MSLRELAEADLAGILEDADNGSGWPIDVTNPQGRTVPMVGYSEDIAQAVDPETGMAVSGRYASVALRISSLIAAGVGLPRGVADARLKPWLVRFEDINGAAHLFKVAQSNPDRMLGLVTLTLEVYSE